MFFCPCPREFQDVLLFLLLVRAVLLRRRFGPVSAFGRVVTASNNTCLLAWILLVASSYHPDEGSDWAETSAKENSLDQEK